MAFAVIHGVTREGVNPSFLYSFERVSDLAFRVDTVLCISGSLIFADVRR